VKPIPRPAKSKFFFTYSHSMLYSLKQEVQSLSTFFPENTRRNEAIARKYLNLCWGRITPNIVDSDSAVGYRDFNNLMGFTSKKLPCIFLKKLV
jgi:hypothetical protein